MEAGVYLNFKKEARDAIAHYENVFNTKATGIMTYGEMPEDPNFTVPEATRSLVLNANMYIHGMSVMFSDVPDGMGMEYTQGSNITLVISTKDEEVLTKEFEALAKDGKVQMPLGKTFWSDKYGSLVDKYGIGWQFSLVK